MFFCGLKSFEYKIATDTLMHMKLRLSNSPTPSTLFVWFASLSPGWAATTGSPGWAATTGSSGWAATTGSPDWTTTTGELFDSRDNRCAAKTWSSNFDHQLDLFPADKLQVINCFCLFSIFHHGNRLFFFSVVSFFRCSPPVNRFVSFFRCLKLFIFEHLLTNEHLLVNW